MLMKSFFGTFKQQFFKQQLKNSSYQSEDWGLMFILFPTSLLKFPSGGFSEF